MAYVGIRTRLGGCARVCLAFAAGVVLTLALMPYAPLNSWVLGRCLRVRYGHRLSETLALHQGKRLSPTDLVAIADALFAAEAPTPARSGRHWDMQALERELRACGEGLKAYARRVRAGEIDKEPGRVTYPPPSAYKDTLGFRWVTLDENGNVYFIFDSSWVTFDHGVVLRRGDAELLGDGCEPEMALVQHLLDDWWYYAAH